ncbi:hypothetical protein DFR70_1339 [Nocardia tenerifensis]|uniref:Uncharacterized protein n=1 Tax=Nocardia tenerifensis TaxID=228006 RepID=A0A318JN22_9NOCA|nr:hypothetical protein [Nocardia tenerifensis]PXX52277.1 hypothetical protein DFR70_1339 [Nocardia tenerifensis]
MGTKAERRVARERVAAYHEAQLSELVKHVEQEIARFRAGELDVFEVAAVIHRYHRAAQKLWTFCDQSGAHVESTAQLIERMPDAGEAIDWWQRGETAKPKTIP